MNVAKQISSIINYRGIPMSQRKESLDQTEGDGSCGVIKNHLTPYSETAPKS